MTVNGHWHYEITIIVQKFCDNKDDLRKILFDLWQYGLKLMFQAIMQRSISLNFSNRKYDNDNDNDNDNFIPDTFAHIKYIHWSILRIKILKKSQI